MIGGALRRGFAQYPCFTLIHLVFFFYPLSIHKVRGDGFPQNVLV